MEIRDKPIRESRRSGTFRLRFSVTFFDNKCNCKIPIAGIVGMNASCGVSPRRAANFAATPCPMAKIEGAPCSRMGTDRRGGIADDITDTNRSAVRIGTEGEVRVRLDRVRH